MRPLHCLRQTQIIKSVLRDVIINYRYRILILYIVAMVALIKKSFTMSLVFVKMIKFIFVTITNSKKSHKINPNSSTHHSCLQYANTMYFTSLFYLRILLPLIKSVLTISFKHNSLAAHVHSPRQLNNNTTTNNNNKSWKGR